MLFFANKKKIIITDKLFNKVRHTTKIRDLITGTENIRSLVGLGSFRKNFLHEQCVESKNPSLDHVVFGDDEIGYALKDVDINDIALFYIVNRLKFISDYDDNLFFVVLLYLFGFVDKFQTTLLSKKTIKISDMRALFNDKTIMDAALSTKGLIRVKGY